MRNQSALDFYNAFKDPHFITTFESHLGKGQRRETVNLKQCGPLKYIDLSNNYLISDLLEKWGILLLQLITFIYYN